EAAQLMRRVNARRAAAGLVPTDHAHLVFTTEKEIVGNQEVARTGVLRPNSRADVLEAAVAHSLRLGAHYVLLARKVCHLALAERQRLETALLRCYVCKNPGVASAVEVGVSVAGRLDGDRLLRRARRRERVRPGERRAERFDIVVTPREIQAFVH